MGLAAVDLQGWSLTDEATQLRKWQFPSTNLNVGQYLVAFASNKDRRVSGNPLHTNFRLSASGEYLALVEPDGKTIASEFAPTYPPQAKDTSYGHPSVTQTLTMLGPGARGKLLIPKDDSLETDWTLLGFSDADWLDVNTGVGFDLRGNSLTNLLESQVPGLMHGGNASAYLRRLF